LHRNGKPSGVIEAGRHCLPHAVCRTAVQEDKPTLRGHRECVEFDRERIRRFSIGLAQGTGLVTDALDSSKMTLMPSTTRNKANVHSRAKRSLAKVCGAAESGLSLVEAML
jgi:hypothetical protein